MEPSKAMNVAVAMIRLRKPLAYYEHKYGTSTYALDKLYLMMEKQHNRGQEGAGLACVKLDQQPGTEYMYREKAEGKDAITKIFASVHQQLHANNTDDPYTSRPLSARCTWVICVIPQRERRDWLMCTRFCAVITGGQRTSVYVVTST